MMAGAACNVTRSWPPWGFIVGGCVAVLVFVGGYMALLSPGAYAGEWAGQSHIHSVLGVAIID